MECGLVLAISSLPLHCQPCLGIVAPGTSTTSRTRSSAISLYAQPLPSSASQRPYCRQCDGEEEEEEEVVMEKEEEEGEGEGEEKEED